MPEDDKDVITRPRRNPIKKTNWEKSDKISHGKKTSWKRKLAEIEEEYHEDVFDDLESR